MNGFSAFSYQHGDDLDRFLSNFGHFADETDITVPTAKDRTKNGQGMLVSNDLPLGGVPIGFQQALLEQSEEEELQAMTPLFNTNTSIAPALALAKNRSPSEHPNRSPVATTPTRAAQRGRLVRRRYDSEKWTSMKNIIRELYIDQGLPLLKVMQTLENTYDFTASYVSFHGSLCLLVKGT